MPELPEVQTIVNDLNQHIIGYSIKSVKVLRTVGHYPGIATFNSEIVNQKITGIERIAKNIVIHMKSNKVMVVHLGMTGRVILQDYKQNTPKWTRVILKIQKGAITKTINLADTRMFGKITILDKSGVKNLKSNYGPDPLEKISPAKFLQTIRSKRTIVKNVLLDQKVISGLGNIYATEALFLAKVHPESPTMKMTLNRADRLLKSARVVLREGLKNRGSTLDDKMYVDIFGKDGSHQDHFKIYGKEICPNCKNKVSYKKLNGRGTYFCPSCQTF
jgi:formamidopyrimidine-DNA glycosylase